MPGKKRQSAVKVVGSSDETSQSPPDDLALTLPSLQEWQTSYERFREALMRLYDEPASRWGDNDTAFCQKMNLSRAQFSRVMTGGEKPSPSILKALAHAVQDVYEDCRKRWLEDRDTDKDLELASILWARISRHFPGTTYVLTSRPLERESDALLRTTARFLESDGKNRLTFVFGNLAEEWAQRVSDDELCGPCYVHRWSVIDYVSIGRYIDEILRHLGDGDAAYARASQLQCLRVSFLDILAKKGQVDPRVAELLASQVLSPLLIWMLFVGSNAELVGFVYFRCGNKYRWFPLASDEAESLHCYVSALCELRSTDPDVIKELNLEALSSRLQRLKKGSQTTTGRKG